MLTALIRYGLTIILLCAALVLVSVALGQGLEGEELAFVANWHLNADIYVMDVNKSIAYNLTRHQAFDGYPAWSPDGSRLAFLSNRRGAGSMDVYIMNSSGRGVYRFTTTEGSESAVSWSPDGSQIAYVRQYRPYSRIYIGELDTNDSQQVGDGMLFTARVAWSWSQDRLLFDERAALFIMDVDGENLQTIDLRQHEPTLSASEAAWSPDGTQIVFTCMYGDNSWDLCLINADGTNPRKIMDSHEDTFMPAWSPDGKYIAFVAEGDVYMMDSAGGNLRRLTRQGARNGYPAWRPG